MPDVHQTPQPAARRWQVGEFEVDLDSGDLCGCERPDQRLPPRVLAVLACLLEQPGELVSKRSLLERVWADSPSGEDVLSNAVWSLRRAFGEQARSARYIETLPKRGYRLLAQPCEPLSMPVTAAATIEVEPDRIPTTAISYWGRALLLAVLCVVVLLLSRLALLHDTSLNAPSAGDAPVWTAHFVGQSWSTPLLQDGQLVVASDRGALLAYAADHGTLRWSFLADSGLAHSPLAVGDSVQIGSREGWWYAIAADSGRERWRQRLPSSLNAQPVLSEEEVWLPLRNGQLLQVDAERGTPGLSIDVGPARPSTPAFDGSGTGRRAFVLDDSGQVQAFRLQSFQRLWARRFEPTAQSRMVAVRDRLWLTQGERLLALDPDSGEVLDSQTFDGRLATPVAERDGLWVLDRQSGLFGPDPEHVHQAALAFTPAQDVRPAFAAGSGLLAGADRVLWLLSEGQPSRALARLDHTPTGLALDAQHAFVLSVEGRLSALPLTASYLPAPSQRVHRWSQASRGSVTYAPRGHSGRIYAADEAELFALDSDSGRRLWSASLPAAAGGSPMLYENAQGELRIAVGCRNGDLISFDLQGLEQWRRRPGAPLRSTALWIEGLLIIGDERGVLHALRVEDGGADWSFRTGEAIYASPQRAGNGLVFGSGDGHVYHLGVDGELLWKTVFSDWVVAAPVVTATAVFAADSRGEVQRLRLSDGVSEWRTSLGAAVWYGGAADDARVYFASGDGHLYALAQADGREQWRHATGDRTLTQPQLWRGQVVFGSHDGGVRGVSADNGRLCQVHTTASTNYNPTLMGDLIVIGAADQRLTAFDFEAGDCEH